MLVRLGTIAAVAIILAVGISLYLRHEHNVRQQALQSALQIETASLGQQAGDNQLNFASEADRTKAAVKAWTEIAAKYSGTDVGTIAEYFLASHAADAGNVQEAERRFKEVADSGKTDYASLAKLSLAQIYASSGKIDDAKRLLQSVIDHPNPMVSKDAATIALAHVMAQSNPQEARKLLEPLRGSDRPAVSRAALSALGELPK